jgi:hypothetical protein
VVHQSSMRESSGLGERCRVRGLSGDKGFLRPLKWTDAEQRTAVLIGPSVPEGQQEWAAAVRR